MAIDSIRVYRAGDGAAFERKINQMGPDQVRQTAEPKVLPGEEWFDVESFRFNADRTMDIAIPDGDELILYSTQPIIEVTIPKEK
jgi:hypothetical protein